MNNAPFRVVCIREDWFNFFQDKPALYPKKGKVYTVISAQICGCGICGELTYNLEEVDKDIQWNSNNFAPVKHENISSEIAQWKIVEEREDRILETVNN